MHFITIEPINDSQTIALQQIAIELRRVLALVETALPMAESQVPVIDIEE